MANPVPDGPAPWRSPARMRLALSFPPGPALPGCKQPLWSDLLQVNISAIASLVVLPKTHPSSGSSVLRRCQGSCAVLVAGREGGKRQMGCADLSICCHVHHRGFSTNYKPLITSNKGLFVGPRNGEAHGGVNSFVRERSPITGSI